MTATATTMAEDPLSSSGHTYPDAAKGEVQAYWWHLDALRGSRTRAEAARRAGNLAVAAGRTADALPAPGEGAGGTWADPRAWASLSVHLALLTLALDGGPVGMPGGWANLAAARTRAEFSAAWQPVGECLRHREPPQPAFAVAQVAKAAAVILGAPW